MCQAQAAASLGQLHSGSGVDRLFGNTPSRCAREQDIRPTAAVGAWSFTWQLPVSPHWRHSTWPITEQRCDVAGAAESEYKVYQRGVISIYEHSS